VNTGLACDLRFFFAVMKLSLSILLLILLAVQSFAQSSPGGQLLKSNGKPLAFSELELVPVGSNKLIVESRLVATHGISGKFTLVNVGLAWAPKTDLTGIFILSGSVGKNTEFTPKYGKAEMERKFILWLNLKSFRLIRLQKS
jgi:hypothetical protein